MLFRSGHHGCGMSNLDTKSLINKMVDRGIKEETLSTLKNSGINVEGWLHGFESVEDSIKESIRRIKDHPLFPKGIRVHGLIMDSKTGKIDVIINADNEK